MGNIIRILAADAERTEAEQAAREGADGPLPTITRRAQLIERYKPVITRELEILERLAQPLTTPLTPDPGPLPEERCAIAMGAAESAKILWPAYGSNSRGGRLIEYDKVTVVGGTSFDNKNQRLRDAAETILERTNGSPAAIVGSMNAIRNCHAWAREKAAWRVEESARLKREQEAQEEREVRAMLAGEAEAVAALEAELGYRALAGDHAGEEEVAPF